MGIDRSAFQEAQEYFDREWWPNTWQMATAFLPIEIPLQVEQVAQKIARAAFSAGYTRGAHDTMGKQR